MITQLAVLLLLDGTTALKFWLPFLAPASSRWLLQKAHISVCGSMFCLLILGDARRRSHRAAELL